MTIRNTYIFAFLVVFALLGTSLYLQFVDGVIPCPLCSLQRITFAILGILFLLGIFLYKKRCGRFVINCFTTIFSVLGICLSGRQIWLQQFPSANSNECGVSIQYMLQAFPMSEVLQKIFQGSTECAARGWEFLHLNMAEWALIWFIGFLLITFCLFLEEIEWHKLK